MAIDHLTESELESIIHQLEVQKKELSDSSQETLGQMMEDDTKGGDSLDRTVFEQTNSTLLRLKDRDLRRVYDIDDALQRLKEGSYGFCEVCEEPIKKARLLHNPVAKTCIDCQEEIDAENDRKRYRIGLLEDPHRF